MPREYDTDKPSCCDKCCRSIANMQLHLFNTIDFFVGCAFISFAGNLMTTLGMDKFQDPSSSWIGWGTGILGALLLIISLLGFCALTISSCRWAMTPSRWLSFLAFLSTASLGIICEVKKKVFFDFVSDAKGEGLTQDDIDLLKTYFVICTYVLFAMSGLHLYRFILTRNYRKEQLRIDGEYEALLEEEDKKLKGKLESKDKERSEKYEDLRAYYKNKYSKDNKDNGSNSSSTANNKV